MSIASKKPIISVSHLSYSVQGEEVFRDFSFSIERGAYVGVLGPNGGGKTTLLRLLLGLLEPSSGKITIDGVPVREASARRMIGYVAQRGGNLDPLFPATVEEVVRAGRTPHLGFFDVYHEGDESAVQQAMKQMGIESLAKRPMSHLSGGQRQKVLLARAMAGEPHILCLDEPVDGLDPASRESFYALLRNIHQSGVTIVFVSHDVHTIAHEADSAICLKHQLVCHGHEACHVGKGELKNLYHASREDMLKHHGE